LSTNKLLTKYDYLAKPFMPKVVVEVLSILNLPPPSRKVSLDVICLSPQQKAKAKTLGSGREILHVGSNREGQT